MTPAPMTGEPGPSQLAAALVSHVGRDGAVPSGVVRELVEQEGWSGRLVEILSVLTEDSETMGYLAGGRRPDEVATWLSVWAESPLTVEQIRLVVVSGGWEPDSFVELARAGLLERVLRRDDGSPRRIRGELAGGWESDELALASEGDVLSAARRVLEGGADASS